MVTFFSDDIILYNSYNIYITCQCVLKYFFSNNQQKYILNTILISYKSTLFILTHFFSFINKMFIIYKLQKTNK